jgi:hypothetical protein
MLVLPISDSFQSAISENEMDTYYNKEVNKSIIKLYNLAYGRIDDNGKILNDIRFYEVLGSDILNSFRWVFKAYISK